MTAVLPKAPRKPYSVRTSPGVPVSDSVLEDLTDLFKMLSDKSRLKILLALAQEKEMNVTALCDLLEESQPAVSHHLLLLRRRSLVSFRREGKSHFYRIDSDWVGPLLEQFFVTLGPGNGVSHLNLGDFSLILRRKA